MISIRTLFIAALLILFGITEPVFAEEKTPIYLKDPRGENFNIPKLNNQDPRERLQRSVSRDTAGADNIVIKKIDSGNWPQRIKKQIEIAATACIDGTASIDDIEVYSYETDFHRTNNFSPNYIVDYKKWADKTFKRCHLNIICEKQNCAWVGFTSTGAEEWNPEQPVFSSQWAIALPNGESFHNEDKAISIPHIESGALFLSRTVGRPCNQAPKESTAMPEDCIDDYSWDNDGITIVSQ